MESISRRTVLAASAGAWVAGRLAGAAESPSASERVILALVGAGGRGSALSAGFAGLPNVRFKYVCDVNLRQAGTIAKAIEKAGPAAPQPVDDLGKVLADREVDGVIVATPEHWHALATIQACQAGKDVYVEKNPSLTVWEGRQMIAAARKYKRIVQVGFQNRSAPYAASARDYIKSGKLGKVARQVHTTLAAAPGAPARLAHPRGLDWTAGSAAPLVPYNSLPIAAVPLVRHARAYSAMPTSRLARMAWHQPAPKPPSASGHLAYERSGRRPSRRSIIRVPASP